MSKCNNVRSWGFKVLSVYWWWMLLCSIVPLFMSRSVTYHHLTTEYCITVHAHNCTMYASNAVCVCVTQGQRWSWNVRLSASCMRKRSMLCTLTLTVSDADTQWCQLVLSTPSCHLLNLSLFITVQRRQSTSVQRLVTIERISQLYVNVWWLTWLMAVKHAVSWSQCESVGRWNWIT